MSEALKRAVDDEGGLASTVDLAAKWGVSESRARQITAMEGFPEPLGAVSDKRMKIWSVEDALAYREAMQ